MDAASGRVMVEIAIVHFRQSVRFRVDAHGTCEQLGLVLGGFRPLRVRKLNEHILFWDSLFRDPLVYHLSFAGPS